MVKARSYEEWQELKKFKKFLYNITNAVCITIGFLIGFDLGFYNHLPGQDPIGVGVWMGAVGAFFLGYLMLRPVLLIILNIINRDTPELELVTIGDDPYCQ